MKVLIVTGIFPPDPGGPASYVPYIADALISNGHEVVGVISLSECIKFNDSFNYPIIRILRKSPKFIRMLKTIFTIYSQSKTADVVYLNGLVLEGVTACKFLSKKPVVVKVVGDLIWEKASNNKIVDSNLEGFQQTKLSFYWAFLRKLQSIYTGFADAIIVPSEFLGKIVNCWGIEFEKINVIYNAATPPLDKKIEKSSDEFDLVTVARLVPWKGISEVIMVCEELGLSLLIVGDGPLRQSLENLVKDKKINATFTGNVPHKEVSQHLKRAKLFVLNSLYEGLPHIVLEAKLNKIAVLATDAGGTVETISHNIDGWLVPVGDYGLLRQSIYNILNDRKLRSRLSNAGYKQVLSKFNPEVQIKQTISVLLKVQAINKDTNK